MASSSSNRTSQGLAQGASGRRVAPAGQQLAIAPKPEGFSAHGLHVGTVTGSEAAAALRDQGSSAEEQAALLRHDRIFVRQAGSLQEFCSPSGQVVARLTVADVGDYHRQISPPSEPQAQIHPAAQHLAYQRQHALVGSFALGQSGQAGTSHSLVTVGPSQVARYPPSGLSANFGRVHERQPQQQKQYRSDQQLQQAQQVVSFHQQQAAFLPLQHRELSSVALAPPQQQTVQRARLKVDLRAAQNLAVQTAALRFSSQQVSLNQLQPVPLSAPSLGHQPLSYTPYSDLTSSGLPLPSTSPPPQPSSGAAPAQLSPSTPYGSAAPADFTDSWTPDLYDTGRRPALSAVLEGRMASTSLGKSTQRTGGVSSAPPGSRRQSDLRTTAGREGSQEQRSSQVGPQRRNSASGRTKPLDTSARRSPFRHGFEDDDAGLGRSLSFSTRTTSCSDVQESASIAVGLSRSTSERRLSSHNPIPPAFGSRSVARSEANTSKAADASRPGSVSMYRTPSDGLRALHLAIERGGAGPTVATPYEIQTVFPQCSGSRDSSSAPGLQYSPPAIPRASTSSAGPSQPRPFPSPAQPLSGELGLENASLDELLWSIGFADATGSSSAPAALQRSSALPPSAPLSLHSFEQDLSSGPRSALLASSRSSTMPRQPMSESMQAFYHELAEQRRQAHGAQQHAATSTTSASRTTQTQTAAQDSALSAIAHWTPAEETDVLDALMRGEFDELFDDTHVSQLGMPEQPDL